MSKIINVLRKIFANNELKKPNTYANTQGIPQYRYQDIIKYMKENGELNIFFQEYNKIMQEQDKYYKSPVHGIDHTFRVTFFATILSSLDDFSAHDKELLLTAARYHDIGRRNDKEDKEHGDLSVQKTQDLDLLARYSEDDRKVIEFVIKQHSLSREENEIALRNLPENKREKYRLILSYLKDADALDRVRILNRDMQLDPNRLRSETARQMVDLAYDSYQKFDSFIETNREYFPSLEPKFNGSEVPFLKGFIDRILNRFIKKEALLQKANNVEYEPYNPDIVASDFEKSGELENYYEELRKITQDKDKFYPSNVNGIEHTARVTFFAIFLAKLDNFSESDKKLLLLAARYHDIGRVDDDTNNYGEWSVQKIESKNLLEELSPEDISIVKFAIKQHSLPLKENEKSLRKIPFWKRERYRLILNYLKDAETLDKLGNSEGSMQEESNELITQTSKRLVPFAHKVHRVFLKENVAEYLKPQRERMADSLVNENDMLKYMELSGGINFLYDTLNKIMQDKELYLANHIRMGESLKLAFWATNIATLENLSHSNINILLAAVRYKEFCNQRNYRKKSDSSNAENIREENLFKNYSEDDKHLIKFLIEQCELSEKENETALRKVSFFKRKKYKILLDCIKDAEKLKQATDHFRKKSLNIRSFRLNSSKQLRNVAEIISEKEKFMILMIEVCKKMIPEFENAYNVFDEDNLSQIYRNTCSCDIMKLIIQIEEWRRRGVLEHYKEEKLLLYQDILYPNLRCVLKASNQIEKGDYETILAQGYKISYEDFLRIINFYPVGVLEQLRKENRLVDIFSYNTFCLHDDREWYENGLVDYRLLERIQRSIFEPKKKSEISKDFMLYKLMGIDGSNWLDEMLARGFWKYDIKERKDYFEDIHRNPKYEASIEDEDYQKLWQKARENGFDVGEEEFKEKFKYYKFMFSTNIDMKILKGYDISKVYNIYNMLCYSIEKAIVKDGKEINMDTDLIRQLLEWDLDKYNLKHFEQFEIVYGIVTEHPVTKDNRLLNYLNNRSRYFRIKKIEDLENYNAYCLDEILKLNSYRTIDMIASLNHGKRSILLQSLLGSCIPEGIKIDKYSVCNSILSELYFYQKYKKNGDFDEIISDTGKEREIDQVISEIINTIDGESLYEARVGSRLLRKKYIDIPAIIKLVNERMEYLSRKNIVQELAKTKKIIKDLPVQYIEYEGEQIPIKFLEGQDFCLATSTLMPACSGVRIPREELLDHILNWPLNTRHRRVSFTNQYMLARAIPVNKELEVAYAYFPDSPRSIEMTADRDLSTVLVNDVETDEKKVVSMRGINQNRKLIDIINSTGYDEHNEGVLDNVYPECIVCYDEISETSLKKYKLLKEQGYNVELLVVKVKEKYLPQMETRFNQDVDYIRNEIRRTKTLSKQTMDTYFNEYENNMCIRALQMCLTGIVSVEEKLPQLRDLLKEVAECIPQEYINTLIRQIDLICSLELKMYNEGICDYCIFGFIKRSKLYTEEYFDDIKESLRIRKLKKGHDFMLK